MCLFDCFTLSLLICLQGEPGEDGKKGGAGDAGRRVDLSCLKELSCLNEDKVIVQ